MNSVLLASATSLLATLFAAMGGYALAKFEFRAKKPITGLVLLVLLVPAPLLLAPTYQLLYQLGLLDTYMGLILPAAGSAFGVFLFRQAMLNSYPMPSSNRPASMVVGKHGSFSPSSFPWCAR